MRARSGSLGILVAAGALVFGSGCATAGEREARAFDRFDSPSARLGDRAERLPPVGASKVCATGAMGGAGLGSFNFLFFGLAGGGQATFVATAIPGVPFCALGALLGAPAALVSGSSGPIFAGAIAGDVIGTPVIFPFWLAGRALDALSEPAAEATPPSGAPPAVPTPSPRVTPVAPALAEPARAEEEAPVGALPYGTSSRPRVAPAEEVP